MRDVKLRREESPVRCIGCGSTAIDLQRGWIRNPFDRDRPFPPTWFACNDCLNGGLALDWTPTGPHVRTPVA